MDCFCILTINVLHFIDCMLMAILAVDPCLHLPRKWNFNKLITFMLYVMLLLSKACECHLNLSSFN